MGSGVLDVDRLPPVTPEVKNECSCTFTPPMKGKDKAIPVYAWTGPEDTRRLRLPDFITLIS